MKPDYLVPDVLTTGEYDTRKERFYEDDIYQQKVIFAGATALLSAVALTAAAVPEPADNAAEMATVLDNAYLDQELEEIGSEYLEES